jgi:uncharacterized protein (DUF2336 family)
MGLPASLLPELEHVVQQGSAERRAEMLRRITTLFLDSAAKFSDEHIALFDDVIGCLIEQIAVKALAELSRRLAPVSNAPAGVIQKLAMNDDIAVAGPVLKHEALTDFHLIEIAETKSQAHLVALSARAGISEKVSDVLVTRGNREVVRTIANNQKAKLSETALDTLVNRAEGDGILAERVALRTDIPPHLFKQLIVQASEVVRMRLLALAKPELQAEIQKVLAMVTGEVASQSAPRNYVAALAAVRALHREHKLGETEIANFAESKKYEETIAALATVAAVPVEVVDRLMSGERTDPVLILARAVGFSWPTVKAILCARTGVKLQSATLNAAAQHYEKLSESTAQRVVRFWQVRRGTE